MLQDFPGNFKGLGQKFPKMDASKKNKILEIFANGQNTKDVFLVSPWEFLMLLYFSDPCALLNFLLRLYVITNYTKIEKTNDNFDFHFHCMTFIYYI